eukprot:CAMPEP_0202692712 /NCGR_PEP_ID=MMETSP1385-20130828/7021_1 /ASSEMBLY_ACC=CAM_ASM_000861 /TAXON_ID=933848 /ORGANISM="Elphidium margaritaceum" /LENGTH=558 /DNA_ID=CAMNT_0049348293 /DNA_START=43 /DNA_END=1716 /DNA_ORIENTATION=-
MPVTPQYSWAQTDDKIEIQIQIAGVHSRLLRHITQITPVFFNLNFPPYLLQIDFEGEVNPLNVKVILLQNKKEIKFIFPKKAEGEKWKDLIIDAGKEQRLERRHESIDRLHAKQQEIRERRAKQRKLRQRAAQQRQWDEQKYLKHVMNKLEREEQEKCATELQQWTAVADNDDNKESIATAEIPAIRKAVDVDIKLSEWNYVVPAREDCKPPPFAQKSVVFGTSHPQSHGDKSSISITEKTPAFLFDKALQYITNKDYNSCIYVLDEIIDLAHNDSMLLMLAYCHKMQCFIALHQAGKRVTKSEMESLAQRALETVKSMQQLKSKQHCLQETDDRTVAIVEVVILFQRCITRCWCVLSSTKHFDDNNEDVRKLWQRGCKIFDLNQNTFDDAKATDVLGMFKDKHMVQELRSVAGDHLNVMNMIDCKQRADTLLKEKQHNDAIGEYDRIITESSHLQNTEHVSLLKQQCLNNRSTAYFSSKQFLKCVDDCSELISSCNEANYVHKAHIKRAASYLALWHKNKNENNYLQKSIGDYQIAAKHDTLYESYVSKISKFLQPN